MGQELSLVAVIQSVGKDIYERIEPSTDIHQELKEWMSEFGLEEASNPERTVCDLAAFNRFLKLTLYSEYRQEGVELTPFSVEEDIYAKLVKARSETGDEAFRENPLDGFTEHLDPSVFAPLLEAREQFIEVDTPTDKVGQIFEDLVDQAVRRKRGQFRTPEFIGDFMAQWAVNAGDDIVLDPGIGGGLLTARMYDQKQAAPEEADVDEMWGVDISDLAVVMASTGLKLENGFGSPNFHQQDYMDTLVEGSLARLNQHDPLSIPKVDAIVSNPPYSRSEALDKDRERYNKIVDAEAGVSMWGQAPLFAYFFAHSEQFLSDGARMAFITSSQFFDTIYGEDIREFLCDRFIVHGFVFLDLESEVFEGADVTPCITLLEKGVSENDHRTRFITVENWPENPSTILEAVNGEQMGNTSFGFINQVPQSKLDPQKNWRRHVNDTDVDTIPGLTKFSQVATIKRGIATGMNDFFCLTQEEVDEWGLDKRYLSKLIRRTGGFDALEITDDHWASWRDRGDEVWLLYCYEDGEAIENVTDEALAAYLEYGCEVGADESYLAANRNPWYVVDERDYPDILATYMSKDGFRFIRNHAGIRTLNNLHNITLPDFEDSEIDALLAYLNSNVADEITKRSGRIYARGLHKIEPNELKDVPVIDTRNLSDDNVERLAKAYRNLCSAISDEDQQARKASETLNRTVREVLELPAVDEP